jgi:hypothetical protein
LKTEKRFEELKRIGASEQIFSEGAIVVTAQLLDSVGVRTSLWLVKKIWSEKELLQRLDRLNQC